jgi:fatty-acyl-CoA synthase
MAITTLNAFKPWLKKELSEERLWDLKKKQGIIVSGLDIKIVDNNGNELPRDGKSSGEILLRGPWITRSYYNAPGTEVSFTEDGFIKSGDAGIKSGGEWISSIDMENALVSNPVVLEAAVVGVSHPKWDERPIALVVLREGFESTNQEEIREHLTKSFAKWQLPDKIIFVDSIPKTSVGKLNKKVIRTENKNIFSMD